MILWLIKFILFFIAAVLISVLFIPVKYSVSGIRDDEYQLYVYFSWAFNLVRSDMLFKGGSKPETGFAIAGHSVNVENRRKKEVRPPREKEKKTGKTKKKIHPGQMLSKDMFKSIRILISDFLRLIKPDKFRLTGIIGFEDPYHTGMLCSFLYCLKRNLKNSDIGVLSAFDREVFEGSFEIEGKLTVAALLFISMKFVFSKPVRGMLIYQIRK